MHEWHVRENKNILTLINEFTGFEFDTDYGEKQKTDGVKITNRVFPTSDDAVNYITSTSYYGNTAYLAAYSIKKLTKGYQAAFTNFLEKYNDYTAFKKNLTIAYGRKSDKVTCPECKSSIALKYGFRFKVCPVCGSKKIISDSNWNTLDTKKRMAERAAENLSKEAEKSGVTFVCGIEWHC